MDTSTSKPTGRSMPPMDKRRRHRGVRLLFDRLDQRLAFAGLAAGLAPPTMAADVFMADGVTIRTGLDLTGSTASEAVPPTFQVHFNHALSRFWLPSGDFRVEQLQGDGSSSTLSAQDVRISEAIDGIDPATLDVTLALTAASSDAQYQFVLLGSSCLSDTDGNSLGTGGRDEVLTSFTVGAGSGATDHSQPLGILTGSASKVVLPVTDDPQSSPLARFNVPSGSVSTLATDFGGADPSRFQVNLFNDEEELIATASGSDLSAINQNLVPGRYDIQIVRQGLAAAGDPSVVTLSLTSVPVSRTLPTVRSITPINFNRLADDSDSIVVQFGDSPVAPETLRGADSIFSLADGTGKSWSLSAIAYDSVSNRLFFAFPQALPAGQYMLMAGSSDGAGSSAANLGSFVVQSTMLPGNDLGTILTGASVMTWKNQAELTPGQGVVQYFSVVQGQTVQVALSNDEVEAELTRVDQAGNRTSLGPVDGKSHGVPFTLSPGIYAIVATNRSTETQQVGFAVNWVATSHESLILGGVGQLPATTGTLLSLNSSAANSATVVPIGSRSQQPERSEAIAGTVGKIAANSTDPAESIASSPQFWLNQTPIGTLSGGGVQSSSSETTAAVPATGVVMALNSSICLTTISTGLPTRRARADATTVPGGPVIVRDESSEFAADVSGAVIGQPSRLMTTTNASGPSDEITAEAWTAAGEPAEIGRAGAVEAVLQTAEFSAPEPTGIGDEALPPTLTAGFASPLSILVAGCLVARGFKRAGLMKSWLRRGTRPATAGGSDQPGPGRA